MAYELALNPDIQEKLINEVDERLRECQEKLTYEGLMKMKYLDMVTSETLRLRTPGLYTVRDCNKPFLIEPVKPHEKPLLIEKSTSIMIPTYAIHRDPNLYKNPYRFDPERFNDKNKHQIPSSAYMPFGARPSNCIASRFALLESKIIIFYILIKFEFVPVEKTEISFQLSKSNITIISEDGYWLELKPRNEA